MGIHLGFLYAGVFLLAIGGVVVAADLVAIDTAILTSALGLWPIAIVAIGAAIVVRRSSIGLPAGMLAATLPGLVLGGALAAAPRFVGDCGAPGEPVNVASEQGSFVGGPAAVSLTIGCGSLTVRTAPGNDWAFEAGSTAGRAPLVQAEARTLTIGSTDHDGSALLGTGRDAWDLTLPTTDLDRLRVVTLANRSRLDLTGAFITRLELQANAAEILVDASGGFVSELDAVVNVGSMSIQLPAGDVAGSLRVGAGEVDLCLPEGVGIRVTSHGGPGDVTIGDVEDVGPVWQSPDYESAPYQADLDVRVDLGSVNIKPIGGCK